MIVGVIGSGSIGPDLAYGFVSSLAKAKGAKVYLLDIKQEALDAGLARIEGYIKKGVVRGKINPKAAKAIQAALVTTQNMADLADCDYVLEAASENLSIKRQILRQLEDVVKPGCLIGFATSGIPRSQIAAEAKYPARCFVNHPFFPAWRAKPIEVVLSGDEVLGERMLSTLQLLGKVPIVTEDVPCFAADDIFVNYCAEAARIVADGVATPAQVDAIVNKAIGGGGPFNVMDLTKGNLLNIHCLELLRGADHGTEFFDPPPSFATQANTPWHDRKNPGDPTHDEALAQTVLDRMLAVVMARTYFVVEKGVCDPSDLNWLTRHALGFKKGLLDIAEKIGVEELERMTKAFAEKNPGFFVPKQFTDKSLVSFFRNVTIERDEETAIVMVRRPEAMNALSDLTMEELKSAFMELDQDKTVKGIILTGFDGALAGADITELAVLKTPKAAEEKSLRSYKLLDLMSEMRKPIVAALNGPVLGGGSEISMGCHARVVGPRLMLGQPEVNLGIIPGFGGTQRLPRLIGFERGLDLLRTGRPVGAKEAVEWGWATGEVSKDVLAAAKALIADHVAGRVKLKPVNPEPMQIPDEFPAVDIGEHSLSVDAVLVDALRRGLVLPLAEGLKVEAECFGQCLNLVDMDIGMKNFMQNGPRVPAVFMHE